MPTKVAIIVHGWPQPVDPNSGFVKHLQSLGYQVLCPYFFSQKTPYIIENVSSEIVSLLNNQPVDLLIGFSMGGLILPSLAKTYPQSKLVFVASGPYFKPESTWFYKSIHFLPEIVLKIIILVIFSLPKGWQKNLYKKINPLNPTGGKTERDNYEKAIDSDFAYISKIPPLKNLEIIKFLKVTHNTALLNQLTNSSLIIFGAHDAMMPPALSHKLHQHLTNSTMVESNRHHWEVLNEDTVKKLDKFIARSAKVSPPNQTT